ncbi:STAS domain-containing protein [Acidicapsa dinghuensis]|uniref:STAS domain-containing protein n=1 Tax=Acidicapsa dinghuensis TaxID=2218256 RepID=A0ABW1EMY7_9BACT|nr:STAS domain-containing protein [Acidicapsa dinghuensis]
MTLSLFFNASTEIPVDVTAVTVSGKLIRGCEPEFVNRLTPLAQTGSMQLNLAAISQIDAAGIASLVALYRACDDSGYRLTIVEPSEHVHELLHLVGLEHLLVAANQTCAAGYQHATLTAA